MEKSEFADIRTAKTPFLNNLHRYTYPTRQGLTIQRTLRKVRGMPP
jgi:hypothetical protein